MFSLASAVTASAVLSVAPSFVETFEETPGIDRVPGLHGQALYVGPETKVIPHYPCAGVFNRKSGTVSLWYKPDFGALPSLRAFFQTRYAGARVGSGSVLLWAVDGIVRGDLSDDADSYVKAPVYLKPGFWHHLVLTWNERGSTVYVNGHSFSRLKSDSASPLAVAYGKKRKSDAPLAYGRMQEPQTFSVGSNDRNERMCGAVDDLKIWKVELDAAAVKALYAAETGPQVCRTEMAPDYRGLMKDRVNGFIGPSLQQAGVPGPMELIAEWKPGTTVPTDGETFRSIGKCRLGSLGGVPYLEANAKEYSRFALRFKLDPKAPLHCFEIDYPDDKIRTCDIIIQSSSKSLPEVVGAGNYAMEVGYMTGGEYPNSGRILTHRCLYWTTSDDVSLVMMTARGKKPAAVSAVRVYRVSEGRLPAAKIAEPPATDDGWHRSFGLYYEDPTIHADFARPWGSPERATDLIDRLAAVMKYTGQNVFCYPAVWYMGEIGPDYMPRQHPSHYRIALYEAFDREGLCVIPTMNPNEIVIPEGLVTPVSVKDGSLHDSPVSILSSGEPNPGGWHSTPPNYNVMHPEVRRQVLAWVDKLIAEGRGHSSFKGICLHVTRHSPLWFGDGSAGFNDYTVAKFAEETGRAIPPTIDRKDPLRGKAYADWLTNTCAAAWTDWRCRQVAAFWRDMAKRLQAARPDLKLMVNFFQTVAPRHAGYERPDAIAWACREAGFDPAMFADVPNFVTAEVAVPADTRWMRDARYTNGRPNLTRVGLDALKAIQRTRYLTADDFAMLTGARYPWVNQHDRYWESPVGNKKRSKETLSCDWLTESKWRVSTINPAGRHALRQYAVPLRYTDVLGVSKGGFLVGTYGTEDVLVPWIQAFRSLPAVTMEEFFRKGDVVAREVDFKGRHYCSVCNTGEESATVSVPIPEGSVDTVTGERTGPETHLELRAYELRAFVK